jgi:DNA-binding MarR family transcriptional regulator
MEIEQDRVDRIMAQWRVQRPDLDHSPLGIVGRINLLSSHLRGELERIFEAYGINHGGFDVLASLRRAEAPYRLSPTALFQQLLLTSGAMTNRVDRLEAAGLVERVPDPEDRRSLLVGLTPKGLALVEEAITVHLANEERLIAVLDAGEREILAGLLRKLVLSCEGDL